MLEIDKMCLRELFVGDKMRASSDVMAPHQKVP